MAKAEITADAATTPAPAPSVALDFQDQDLRTVLAALAEAGGVNVSLSNIPATKVTLRMGKAVDKGMVVEGLRLLEKTGGRSGDWKAKP